MEIFRNRYRVALVVLVVVIMAIGGWRLVAGRSQADVEALQTTARVVRGDLEVRVSGTGVVESSAEEEVRTRTGGTIVSINMKEGQNVEAGQVLAELQVQDLSLQIERARLDIEIQERELADLQEEKTEDSVAAPTSGVVRWKVKEGDRVQENASLATIQDQGRMEVVAGFNAAQVKEIRAGQPAEVFIGDYLTSFSGTVESVGSTPRPASGGAVLYAVTVSIDNPGGLAEGTSAWVTVLTDRGGFRSPQEATMRFPEAVEVRSPIAGTVVDVTVADGETAAEGGVIARISDPDRRLNLADQIAIAELRLQQARLDLEDKEKQQRDRVENSRVTAPISGVVSLPAQPKGVGDEVGTGTVLGTVTDYSQMQVVIRVDELDVSKVRTGQEVRLTADALPESRIRGKVTGIATKGVSQSGVATFDVTVGIVPVEGLKVGMTVNADIITDYRQNVLLVPIEAVQQQGGRSFVLVPSDTPDGQPRPVQVRTGAYDTARMEILEGVEEGQEIIVQGRVRAEGTTDFRGTGFMVPGMGGGPGIREGVGR